MGPMRGTYERVTRRGKRTRPRRRKELKGDRERGGGARIVRARAINTRITISATNVPLDFFVSPLPVVFSYPRCARAYFLGIRPLLPPSPAAKRIMRYASLFLPRPILPTLSLARFVSYSSLSSSFVPSPHLILGSVSQSLPLSMLLRVYRTSPPLPRVDEGLPRCIFQWRYARTRRAQLGSLY